MRLGRPGSFFVLLVPCVIVSACSGSVEGRPTTIQPSVTGVTAGGAQASLGIALLTADQVASAEFAPQEVSQRPIGDANFSEDPDPRGPCGKMVRQPSLSKGAIAVFTGTNPNVTLFEVIVDLPAGVARAFVADFASDVSPGCPPFQSNTASGTQTTEFIGQVHLPGIGDQRVCTESRVTPKDGQPFYASGALIRVGDRLIVMGTFSSARPPREFLSSVAHLAAGDLQKLS